MGTRIGLTCRQGVNVYVISYGLPAPNVSSILQVFPGSVSISLSVAYYGLVLNNVFVIYWLS